MGQFGPTLPTTAADDAAVGAVAWSNPDNILDAGGNYATCVLLLGQQSHYLKAQRYQELVPLDATVTGYQLTLMRSCNLLSAAQDVTVQTLKAGVAVGDNKAAAGTWPTSDAEQLYGADGDLWGWTPMPADINDALFGFRISVSALLGVTPQIDHASLTVWYLGSNRAAAFADRRDRFRVPDGMGCAI